MAKLRLFQESPPSTYIGEIEKAADCPHHHLKKIVIDSVRKWSYPRGLDRPDEQLEKEAEARDHAKQYLEAKIPSTLVCP